MKSDPVLDQLFARLSSGTVDAKLRPMVDRVESTLNAHTEWPQAWESLQPELFGPDRPDSIKSCWLFVLRTGQVFGAERHPNSHQRSIALKGSALFEVFVDGVWSGCPIDSVVGAKTISIPAYTWHRIKIGPTHFVSLSFHTVPAKDLIEETPINNDLSITQRRLYHG